MYRPTTGTASLLLTRNAGSRDLAAEGWLQGDLEWKDGFCFQNLSSAQTTKRPVLSVIHHVAARLLPGVASNSPSRRRFGPWFIPCVVSLPPCSLTRQASRMHGGEPKLLAEHYLASMMAGCQPTDALILSACDMMTMGEL